MIKSSFDIIDYVEFFERNEDRIEYLQDLIVMIKDVIEMYKNEEEEDE